MRRAPLLPTEPEAIETVASDPVVRRPIRLDVVDIDLVRGVDLFAVYDDGTKKPVSVCLGSGQNWERAVRFPHSLSEAGQSLGSDVLDEAVRRRAAELLVVVDAAVRAMEARCAA
jgi:hypothetical protein